MTDPTGGEAERAALLAALRAHLDSIAPSPAGKRVLEIGGFGLLAEPWLERDVTVVTLEQSAEAALLLRQQYPNLQVHAGGLGDEKARGGQYEVVLCHGLLVRQENPAEWLRHLAAVASWWVFLETAVCDTKRSALAAPDDAPPDCRCFPSPAYVTEALRRAGFPFVYVPASPPRHPDFRVKWKNNLDWRRGGRLLRCVFVASKQELYLPSLVTRSMPTGKAIYEVAKARPSPWGIDPWPSAGGGAPTAEEVAEACRDLAYLRPLIPYPGYKFDSDWNNPDLAFRMRRKVWTWCLEHRFELTVEFFWHLGLHLRLHLANDLSKQLFVAGCFDPNEFAFLHRVLKPGMTFLDAGANEGLYTVFASRCVGETGRVLAFEPSAREFARLEGNIAVNGLRNVKLYSAALADQDAGASLLIAASEHSGQNTLGAFSHDGVAEASREQVAVRRLDILLAEEGLRGLDVLKIDVEGAETRLLSGAMETLRRFRPALLLEINEAALWKQGSSAAELVGLLESLDYKTIAFEETTGLPAPCEGKTREGNILCLPREKELPEEVLKSQSYYAKRPLHP